MRTGVDVSSCNLIGLVIMLINCCIACNVIYVDLLHLYAMMKNENQLEMVIKGLVPIGC